MGDSEDYGARRLDSLRGKRYWGETREMVNPSPAHQNSLVGWGGRTIKLDTAKSLQVAKILVRNKLMEDKGVRPDGY